MEIANVDFGEQKPLVFEANIASNIGGRIEIRLGSPRRTVIGILDVHPTGGDQSWQLMKCDIGEVQGVTLFSLCSLVKVEGICLIWTIGDCR